MIFDRIELKEADSIVKKTSNKIRKIKFKSMSFKNIANLWKNFRISQLEKRLEKQKDKLVSMEFDSEDFKNRTIGSSLSVAETKVIKKTKAIAKLEAKIEFLKTGNHVSETFISSRAIKLKDNMIKNLTYNTKSVYALSDDKIDDVFEANKKVVTAEDEEMTETQRRIAENVERIIAEKKIEDNVQKIDPIISEKPTEVPVVTVPSREEIRKTVDEMFASQEKEHVITPDTEPEMNSSELEEELQKILNLQVEEVTEPVVEHTVIKESIEEILSKIDVRPVISEEEVEETINEELETVKISQNESTIAKVDKYVNEDGTYRMTREDIDDDFRITSFRNNQEKAPTMVSILRENLFNAQLIAEDENNYQKAPETSSAPINPPAQEDVVRELPIVVPERNESVNKTVKQLSEAVDGVKTMDDIKQIMARVDELRKLQEQTNFKAQAIAEDSAELKAEKSQAVQELLEYQASLQEDYDSSRRKVEEQQAANEELAKEIKSIREVIGGRRM